MSEAKHTPATWTVGSCGYLIFAGGRPIAVVLSDETMQRSERDANAALMVAAPELLEALRGIENSSDYGSPLEGEDNRPLMRAARAAIAKAEGRKP